MTTPAGVRAPPLPSGGEFQNGALITAKLIIVKLITAKLITVKLVTAQLVTVS